MYKAEVLLDSINSLGVRITTFEVCFPRIVLAENNTHRVFSRNYSSSRAIPTYKFIENLCNDPFMPVKWGKAQKGMGASEEISLDKQQTARAIWLEAMANAIKSANELLDLGIAKEITNRLLEPWMWATGIITATEYENFFKLRRTEFAQAEIKVLADMMFEARNKSIPELLKKNKWHIPMVTWAERDLYSTADLLKLSTGRLARVSYLTHDGKRDKSKDMELHDFLLGNRHLSPFEHCAKNMESKKNYGNFTSWKQYRKYIPNEKGTD